MAGATRMKKLDMPMMAKPEEMKSTMNINLKKFKYLNEYDMGDDCQLALSGKVTRINKDEYGHSMTIEINGIDSTIEEDTEDEDEE